ncbi:MAG: hypothetical protein FJ294_10305 [Planctomycetes bacterium]|nr:hypothetical protein [Planctomycetota bacterium]
MELALALVLALPAQKPDGKAEAQVPVELARTSPSALAVEAGRRALEAKALDEACAHGLRALELEPRSAEALALLLDIARDDADARMLWSHEAAAALADERGKLALERALAERLAPKDASVAAIAAARAAAAEELAELATSARKAAEKSVESAVIAGWAAGLGRELVHGAPALLARHASAFPPGFPPTASARKATLEALEKKLGSAEASGDLERAVELALVLRGICAQAGFHDLEGPAAPDLSRVRGTAEAVLERSRQRLREKQGEPWTVERLDELDGDARDAFTKEHARFSNPGVALSPRSWYRVETVCGHATLLGAAATVEDHHTRLANWYGSDPFVGRPGLVRLVAESAGLESEGAPFFWVGGFQSGDVTTLRMSIGSIEGLGRGLTHELTHRFDGALFPGIPSWLAEGRAVWTGAAYANIEDTSFVANHASFGTIDDARYRGYGGRDKLADLVAGTIEDYRDNYVAGYALYVYLNTWYDTPGKPLYRAQLERYMRSRAGDRKSPMAAFEAHFCDGKEGRPKDFDSFAQAFGTFVVGFYWRDRKPFTERYTESAGDYRASRWSETVLDEPTWVWSRGRAEPWLGQDQARSAGFLLRALGDEPGATAAFGWSLAVDERWNSVDSALRELLAGAGKREGAWVLARDIERRGFASGAPAGAAPMLARLPKLRAFLDALKVASAACAADGRRLSAAALAADHDRLADLLGTARVAAGLPALDLAAARLHPFDEPRRALQSFGWSEDKLVGYDDRRAPGLWCLDERAALHVGRSTPRVGTGSQDRASGVHEAFVRSNLWIEPGRWRVRMRIAPTSSAFNGEVVVGYERRDRQARMRFSGGDYAFAIGDKEEPAELASVDWGISGLYERDGGLDGSTRGGNFGFGRTVAAFAVELAIDEGALHLFVENEYLATYHTPDGMPIEGYLGFASALGSYKASEISLQRLDRSATFAPLERVPPAIHLDLPRAVAFRDSLNRRFVGMPLSAKGTLCAWVPLPEPGDDGGIDAERALKKILERAVELERIATRQSIQTPLVLAIPRSLGVPLVARVRGELDARLDPEFRPRLTLLEYGPPELSAARGSAGDEHQSSLLFIDSAGVLRAAESLHPGKKIDGSLGRWVEVFRNR